MLDEGQFWRRLALLGIKAPRGSEFFAAPYLLENSSSFIFPVSLKSELSLFDDEHIKHDFSSSARAYVQSTERARQFQLRIAVFSALLVDVVVGAGLAGWAISSGGNTLVKIFAGSAIVQFVIALPMYLLFSSGMSREQMSRFKKFLVGASLIRVFEFAFSAFAFIFVISQFRSETGGVIVSFVDNWTTSVADFFYDLEGASSKRLLLVDITKGALAFMPTLLLATAGGFTFGNARPSANA